MTAKDIILSAISERGKTNPIRANSLCYKVQKELGDTITDRDVRFIVSELQNEGHAVIPSFGKGGYFLATEIDEIDRYLRTMKAHRNSLSKTIVAVGRNYKKLAGQQSLESFSQA